MDLLREYDFDCLPLIDREFDNPAVRSVVHELIASEMRAFTPANYLSYLPYPELKFSNSTALQAEMQRLETAPSSSSDKLDTSRYNADQPGKEDEKSVQAWKSAVENIKAQLVHQENRLMNAEIAETHQASLWLRQNAAVEQITRGYTAETEATNRQIKEINKARQAMQSKAFPELNKLIHRRDVALQRAWRCQSAYDQVKAELAARGVDAEAVIAERNAQAAMEIDANDAAHNSTVREYEQVNVTEGSATEVDGEREDAGAKRARRH